MKNIAFLLAVFFLAGISVNCSERSSEKKWALKFADAVMVWYDSLIYYQREKPKYEYDYAFLGSALARLANDLPYDDIFPDPLCSPAVQALHRPFPQSGERKWNIYLLGKIIRN